MTFQKRKETTMKIVATVFLPILFFAFRLAAAPVLHLSANVEADVFVDGRKKKMKKFCLPLAFLTAACAKITDMYVPVHIGANTNADIYIGSKMVGTTPAIVRLRPSDLENEGVVLKKKGYDDAEIAIDPDFKQRKTVAATSSDDRVDGYLKSKYHTDVKKICGKGDDFDTALGFSTCSGTSFPAAFATGIPLSATRRVLPYTIVEYEPRQYFVAMRKSDGEAEDPLSVQIRDLILKYYSTADGFQRKYFSRFVSEATGVSEHYLNWRMFKNQGTPDGAANAVANDIELFNEIRSVSARKTADAEKAALLKKLTGVPEKALKYAVSADENEALNRVATLWEIRRLTGDIDVMRQILPNCPVAELRLLSGNDKETADSVINAALIEWRISDAVARNRKKPTGGAFIRDLAARTGLSPAAVDAAMNKSGASVRELTRIAVVQDKIRDFIVKNYAKRRNDRRFYAEIAENGIVFFPWTRSFPAYLRAAVFRKTPDEAAETVAKLYDRLYVSETRYRKDNTVSARLKPPADVLSDIRSDFARMTEIALIRDFARGKYGEIRRNAPDAAVSIDFLHEMTLFSADGLKTIVANAADADEAADDIARLAAFSGRVSDIVWRGSSGYVDWASVRSAAGLTDEEIRRLRDLKTEKAELTSLVVRQAEKSVVDRLKNRR